MAEQIEKTIIRKDFKKIFVSNLVWFQQGQNKYILISIVTFFIVKLHVYTDCYK